MPACATQKTVADPPPIRNLFLPVPDTDLRAFLDEVGELARFAPEIMTAIESDLDAHARAKKKLRLEDREFFQSRTEDLPGLAIEQAEGSGEDLTLDVGRPRMPAEAVYVFLMLRGFLGSLSAKQSRRLLRESMSLYGWLQNRGLPMRVDRLGQKLDVFGLENFRRGWVPRRLEEMDKQEFQICLVAGKANSRAKLKQGYRRLLRKGKKALAALKVEFNALESAVRIDAFAPSRRVLPQRALEQIRNDLSDAQRVIDYASDRVFHEKKPPSTEKVLSLSDGSAAYIKKGDRNPMIGYKPQLARSENGFVASLLVPEGNAADAVELVPAIADSIKRTSVVAELVSTDDGYASAKGRDDLRGMGVKDISISGAKGKKLTTVEDWESETYRDARRYRSAVESLMFTIKDGFAFGELGRRGIDAVRAELLEKVLAYNCRRSILLRQRQREELEAAA